MDIKEYIAAVNQQFKTGIAREHAYRPALQQFLSSLMPFAVVTNEPARVACGAPDFIVSEKKTGLPIAFFEAKDIDDSDLDGRRSHKEQFSRYKSSLDTIVFTDYLDFHLYESGEWVENVRIGEIRGDKIVLVKENEAKFLELISHVGNSHPQKITSASRLAAIMASKARLLAETIKKSFSEENNSYDNRQLQGQYEAFKKVLIHDLTTDAFSDIYAQTIAYGLFAARLHDTTPEDFSRMEAATLIPKSNPFLRQIFQNIAGFNIDDRISWIVDDLVATFQSTDIEKIMGTYSKDEIHNDPMIHFYEDFLAAYDPQLRKAKGVWYTPQPVVQFIVKSVDEILQKEFGLPMGLADSGKIHWDVVNDQYTGKKGETKTISKEFHRVQILDPATGTGTFLAEVIRQVYSKFENMKGMWQGYVEDSLLPRLNGFEILMASYAVAHLKLDMLLKNTGYNHVKDSRFKVFLTNSLEECDPDTGTLFSTWLSDEATEANYIKRDCPVMVMLGNPPYSGESDNKGSWIMNLMDDYKKEPGGIEKLKERNPKWVNDDYVKFIRLGQAYIEKRGVGVLAFINPHGFLDNPTFRGMRWSLLNAFDTIYTLDLHGNANKGETCPDGSADENVFDIKQGVSINFFIKTGKKAKGQLAKVLHQDFFGARTYKYDFLSHNTIASTVFNVVEINAPMYSLKPIDQTGKEDYERGFAVNEIFIINTVGIQTHHDGELVSEKVFTTNNHRYSYRPFDTRWINYDLAKVERPRYSIMKHMLLDNISIIVGRQCVSDWRYVFISDTLSDSNLTGTAGRLGAGYAFPLYSYMEDGTKVDNINPIIWKDINVTVRRETAPEEILGYIYGILYSPTFRGKYKEFLKLDFPRVPYPSSAEQFQKIAEKGSELINLHLMKDADRWPLSVTFPENGDNIIEELTWSAEEGGRVKINKTQYLGNVSAIAWNAYIGGYQPAQKWLKDRKGRSIDSQDIFHYGRILYALEQTDRIMKEIDEIGVV